ncbi:oligosaccharide flippase family protein [Spongisporangium articulatum]|uniref:Oligosaccharide flippase family protein n=1 Tax=Spongisporangium articulatum TaxID=3362603 RepID=A0ABW8AVB7_9ACTN
MTAGLEGVEGVEQSVDEAARPSVLRSGAWSSLTQVAPAISAIVMTPYVVHGLGPDRYGMYILAINLLSFLGSFDGGLTASAGRYFSLYAGAGETALSTRLLVTLVSTVLVLGSAAALLVGVLAPWLVNVVHAPADVAAEGAFLIRVMAFVTVFWLVYSVWCALANAHGRFAGTSLAYVAGYVVLMAGLALVLLDHGGLREVSWVLLAQAVTCVVLAAPSALRFADRSALGFLGLREVREYLSFAWKVQIQGLAGLINSQLASLFSGAVLRVREVGVYNVGANYALQLKFLPLNGLRPVVAWLGRDYGARGRAAAETFERLQRQWVLAVCGWSSMALGSAYFAVQAWLGPAYTDAGVVATVLVAGNVAVLGSGVLLGWLNTVGLPAVEARYSVLSVVLNLALLVALVRPFGIVGTAAATAITQWLSVSYLLWRARAALDGRPTAFVRWIPVVPVAVTVGLTVLLELAARPWLPGGGLGLLSAAAVSVPAGIVYCLLVFGPRRCLEAARGVVHKLGKEGAR